MIIKSPAFSENQHIPSVYSCEGDNINPPLEFFDIPDQAESLALIVDDPDAPAGTFTHWMIWNIPAEIRKIAEGDWPEGAEQGLNSGGELGYMGPCPPSGVHHYCFKLYALNAKLNLDPSVAKEELEEEIGRHLIQKAQLIGIYTRAN